MYRLNHLQRYYKWKHCVLWVLRFKLCFSWNTFFDLAKYFVQFLLMLCVTCLLFIAKKKKKKNLLFLLFIQLSHQLEITLNSTNWMNRKHLLSSLLLCGRVPSSTIFLPSLFYFSIPEMTFFIKNKNDKEDRWDGRSKQTKENEDR